MNRDSFENQIGNSLREARVQVPAGAWQAIQAGLPKSSFVQPNNGINFWLSGITALVMLTGLSLYSEFHVDANHEKMALVEPETLGAEPVLDIMVKTVEVDSTEPQTENSNIASDEDNTPIHHASTTQISERTAEINIAEITPKTIDQKAVDTLVFCSGKIYYEVMEEKERTESGENMAVVRIEQLYPMPTTQLDKIMAKYTRTKNVIWLQEEPENMGAWAYMALNYRKPDWICISPKASASPASGSSKASEIRQKNILKRLFGYAKQPVK